MFFFYLAAHLCNGPLLWRRQTGALSFPLTEFELRRLSPARGLKTQLLSDVMTELFLRRVLKILRERGRQQFQSDTLKKNNQTIDWIISNSFLMSCFLRPCTWLPPMLWHTYMIIGFPPWLFSPTSRQVLDPRFFNCRVHRHKNTFKDMQRKSSNTCWTLYCWKRDSPHQTFLGLNLECRFLGRWCLGTRWSSCNSASLSGSDDQKCPHTYSAKVTWSQLKLNDLNIMLWLR